MTSVSDSRPYIVVLNDTAVIPHHGCKIVMKRILDQAQAWGVDIKTVSVYSDWRIFLKEVDSATAVIVNGEGTLHHSADRGWRLTEVAPYCHERGIPVFLINTVWQDNNSDMAAMAQHFLLRSVRESRSQKQMAKQGLEARMVPDLTLGVDYTPSNQPRQGLLYSDAVGMPVTDLIFRLYRRRGDGLFISLEPPEAHRGNYSATPAIRLHPGPDSDLKLARRLARTRFIKKALIIRGKVKYWWRQRSGHIVEKAVDDFMELLASSELVVTGRFHVVCLCLVTGTPFLAVASNSHKVEGMLEDAGLTHRLVSPEKLATLLDNPPAWTTEDSDKAQAFVEMAHTKQSELFAEIGTMISDHSGRTHQ